MYLLCEVSHCAVARDCLGPERARALAEAPVLAGTFSFGTEELTLADATLFAGVPLCMQRNLSLMLRHCMVS